MKTISIAVLNLKGGSSKSSTIVNLGGVLHESGRKPILIDSDPQQSATRWAEQGSEQFPYPVIPLNLGKNVKKLKDNLNLLIQKHKADTLLFDTPPQLEEEALLAALLADIVLVPVSPSPLDLWAGEKAVETIKEARKERGENLPKAILIPSRLMPNTLLAKEINISLRQFNEPISPSITSRVAMVEAPIAGLPIHLYSPNSHSHVEFKNLLKFVLMNLRK